MKKLKKYQEFKINESKDNYNRVIPRDLFNEAKLLKCVGRLCLMIHNNQTPVDMNFEHDGAEFEIIMLPGGSLCISNVLISIKGLEKTFATSYNSKSNYPFFIIDDEEGEIYIFNENGDFTQDFIDYCNLLEA